ncbi:SpoIIIAH-like family protein [Alicyclobacillus shizuokensis]|uniref:SpoIIIAH-like family protein n=1 Tax=Alicyclobacillus shizuokensis TaxID=392014 RepID=UPI000829E290|nr:SpoIIIAH-like family protein [Alicyclobacillus shizuokensis]MCL6625742.1 SpoIIIAH-like family protein [Alicyclobacillus shizuokensis]
MVKRQTVWLSTMMVLSLMLIGYYTMNGSQNQSGTNQEDTITTTAGDNEKDTGKDTGKSDSNHSSSDNTDGGQTAATGSEDWFISQQTQVQQNLAKLEDTYKNIITNAKSPDSQVAQAQDAIQVLENVRGGIENAHDAIVNDGFKDCVIYPVFDKHGDLTKVNVYVKTDKLSADEAVKVMNIVHQQLNLDLMDVSVQVPKAN